MSHYLGYVYGPEDKATLQRVMRPYNEDHRCSETGGLPPELVVLTNVPVMTLETTLFDMIVEFRKVSGKANYKQMRPILIVDDAMSFLDHDAVRELDAFVISYDLDSKSATAKVVVSRGFWDWWVVGGRWPIQFKSKPWTFARNIIENADISWAVDKEALDKEKEGRYHSLRFGEIDWETSKKERVTEALKVWEDVYNVDATIERASTVIGRMNLPKGVRYYSFNDEEDSARTKQIHAALEKGNLKGHYDGIFSPFDVAGMTRREVIRYAIARTFCPAYAIFVTEGFNPEHGGLTTQHTVYDFSFFDQPSDAECKELIRRVKQLKPSTVVTSVDIHN